MGYKSWQLNKYSRVQIIKSGGLWTDEYFIFDTEKTHMLLQHMITMKIWLCVCVCIVCVCVHV